MLELDSVICKCRPLLAYTAAIQRGLLMSVALLKRDNILWYNARLSDVQCHIAREDNIQEEGALRSNKRQAHV